MQEIVDKIAGETGSTKEQAQRALEVMTAEVRGRMPPKMADKVVWVLAGHDFCGGYCLAALKNRRRSR